MGGAMAVMKELSGAKATRFLTLQAMTIAVASSAAGGPYLPDPDSLGKQVRVEEETWALGGSGNVLFVKIKLKNTATVALKDFVVGCIAIAESGTVLGTPRTTLYQALKPGQSKTFPGVSVGLVNSQTRRVGCSVISASEQD